MKLNDTLTLKNTETDLIRILHCVIGSMNVGGIETMLMELYRNIDKTRFQFDFVVHDYNRNEYEDEILAMGGTLYRIPFYSRSPLRHNRLFYKLLQQHPEYQIIHIHTTYSIMYSDAKIAKKLGRIIVIHSHNSAANTKRALLHRFYKNRFSKIADYRLSCSNSAANWLFTKDDLLSVQIWKNAVKIEQFKFDDRIRKKIREENHAGNKFIIGCVGRLSYQKNQAFLLEIFKRTLVENQNMELWLIGDGENRDALKKRVREMEITEKVVFGGTKNNVNEYMMAMDLLVLTSRWEGLPVVLLEAQATGLPVVIPYYIDEMARLSNSCIQVNDYNDITEWSEKILEALNAGNDRMESYKLLVDAGFDVKTQVKIVEDFYTKIYTKNG